MPTKDQLTQFDRRCAVPVAATPAPQPAESDGSVMVRIDRVYVDAMRGDGLTGPFACVRLVEHEGEPRLELTTAPVPTPDTAEWWREVAQGLGVEIAKLKALVSAPACVASTPQGDVCGLCGRASADHRGPENAAAPAPVEPPMTAERFKALTINEPAFVEPPPTQKPVDLMAALKKALDNAYGPVEPPPARGEQDVIDLPVMPPGPERDAARAQSKAFRDARRKAQE